MPDPALPEPPAELARLYLSVAALADVLRLLLAAETEAAAPGRCDLRVAR